MRVVVVQFVKKRKTYRRKNSAFDGQEGKMELWFLISRKITPYENTEMSGKFSNLLKDYS
jgi:hypothetical protein